MKGLVKPFVSSVGISAVATLLFGSSVWAATFDQNRIIDDQVFNNTVSMSAQQVDAFLNQFPNSCISSNNHFLSRDPTGYTPTNGFTYGSNVTAGQVIYDAASAYGLNPQVLLATLQKEESLVDGSAGCGVYRYASAVGYGCPDSQGSYSYSNVDLYTLNGTTVTSINGTCVDSSSKAGFTQQLIRAAWLLRFGEQRSEGNINWDVQKTNSPQQGDVWDNSDDPQSCYSGPMTQGTWQICPSGGSSYYDGYTTIDGTAVHMDNGATAALYWYTPHFQGNQSFFNIFTNWFGTTYAASYAWLYQSHNVYTDNTKTTVADTTGLVPGQMIYVELKATNMGSYTWYKAGTAPMTLGTSNPQDRISAFCDTSWISCNRPTLMQEDSVPSLGTATFDFWMKAPTTPGTYTEYFNLVAENYTWLNDNGFYLTLTVKPTYQWSYVGQDAYYDSAMTQPVDASNVAPGQRLYLTLSAKNIGNATWTNGGSNPVRLATDNPQDHPSRWHDSSWLGYSRAATLTQTSVAPGQIGTFGFWANMPATKGIYNEYFNLVAEGQSWFNSLGLYYTIQVNDPTYSWSYVSQGAYTDAGHATPLSGSLSRGQVFYLTLAARNTGNTIWYQGSAAPMRLGTSNPYDRTSWFCYSTWLSCQRVVPMDEAEVAPGQIGHFTFTAHAPPDVSGTFNEYFNLVAENLTWLNNLGLHYTLVVQ